MNVSLYKGNGEVRDQDNNNARAVSISMELCQGLRSWHQGKPLVGEAVPIHLGQELPPLQYQFVVHRSAVKIPSLNYHFWGEMGYMYAEKVAGQPLVFKEWSLGKIPLGSANPQGIHSHEPPVFRYADGGLWDCYASPAADCPEYGQLAPVIELSTGILDFLVIVPQEYANGARLELTMSLQVQYSVC